MYPSSSNAIIENPDINSTTSNDINPWWVTGMIDGDGNFYLKISQLNETLKFNIQCVFSLCAEVSPENLVMLNSIKSFFGGIGTIRVQKNVYRYEVYSISDCLIIRDHVLKYPLLTYRLVYFTAWSKALNLLFLNKGKVWTNENLIKVIELKSHFKSGLSQALKDFLKLNGININIVPFISYSPELSNINLFWLAGFINSDGTFGVYFKIDSVLCSCGIAQNIKSKMLMEHIYRFLGFGNIHIDKENNAIVFKSGSNIDLTKFVNLLKTNKVKFYGNKAHDYQVFCECLRIVRDKEHLTKEGRNKLQLLKDSMYRYSKNK